MKHYVTLGLGAVEKIFINYLKNLLELKQSLIYIIKLYDEAGNYIGDSNDNSVRDLLNSAYIEIED